VPAAGADGVQGEQDNAQGQLAAEPEPEAAHGAELVGGV
jgi:hypothetical protein